MEIGIIGGGDMGRLYAREFSKAGYEVNICDLPGKKSILEQQLQGVKVNVLDDGIVVSRRSDLIIYSVEAENIRKAVEAYAASTKTNAIVAGQTSIKIPEIEAFEKFLPADVNIVTCHSLHGPSLSPRGQSLVLINHRSTKDAYARTYSAFEKLGSNIIEMSDYKQHDRVTADTQAVTHVGFESMGTAWKNAGFFPWENTAYLGGIDNVKILMTLRIYSGKSHIYAGLAIMNPYARQQVSQYAKSESELFKMMIQEDESNFRRRLADAADYVFSDKGRQILLDDELMGEFGLGIISQEKRKPNSHLSLLAMVDAWHQMKVNPYDNLICQTPPFRLRLGIVEYLFRNKVMLEESINAALFDKGIRGDDLEFHSAVREWSSLIENSDMPGYKNQFEQAQKFFMDKIPEGKKKSEELIRRLTKI
jgi:prephenate dehydrogenase (NADP+)